MGLQRNSVNLSAYLTALELLLVLVVAASHRGWPSNSQRMPAGALDVHHMGQTPAVSTVAVDCIHAHLLVISCAAAVCLADSAMRMLS
jgi:hypothetical protein